MGENREIGTIMLLLGLIIVGTYYIFTGLSILTLIVTSIPGFGLLLILIDKDDNEPAIDDKWFRKQVRLGVLLILLSSALLVWSITIRYSLLAFAMISTVAYGLVLIISIKRMERKYKLRLKGRE